MKVEGVPGGILVAKEDVRPPQQPGVAPPPPPAAAVLRQAQSQHILQPPHPDRNTDSPKVRVL